MLRIPNMRAAYIHVTLSYRTPKTVTRRRPQILVIDNGKMKGLLTDKAIISRYSVG